MSKFQMKFLIWKTVQNIQWKQRGGRLIYMKYHSFIAYERYYEKFRLNSSTKHNNFLWNFKWTFYAIGVE